LFLLLIPLRILRLWKTPRKVTGSYLQTTKIVSFLSCHCYIMLTNLSSFSLSSASYRLSMSLRYRNHCFELVHH
jgi:hypothetical protein